MDQTYKIIVPGAVIGLILAFSQPFFGWDVLVFAGFGLFFLALKVVKTVRRIFWLGYVAGLIYFLINFKWFWAAYPLNYLGLENPYLAFFFIFLVWILTAGTLALTWGISAGLCKKIDHNISWSSLLVFPSVFTVLEYARSYLIGLVWIGRETPLGPNWTNGNLAYNLHESFLALKLSSWFGIYGVTFAIIFLSLLLFVFLEKRKYKKLFILTLLTVVLIYFPPPKLNIEKHGPGGEDKVIEAAAIQTKIPSQVSYPSAERAAFFKNQLELMEAVSKNRPIKLIVLPEESNFFKNLTLFKNTVGVSRYFSGLSPDSILIIDNSKIAAGARFQSKTIFLDSQKGVIDSYDKHLLTPGGEYVPLIFRALDKILGLNSPAIQNVQEYRTDLKKPKTVVSEVTASKGQKLSAASLICSDIFSPNLAQNAAYASLMISQSSFGFIRGAKDLLAQDLAAVKFRASEAGRYMIKASNFGRSYIISDRGLLEKITPSQDWQILTGSVVLKKNKTLYNKVGDGPVFWASLGVVVLSLFWKRHEYD